MVNYYTWAVTFEGRAIVRGFVSKKIHWSFRWEEDAGHLIRLVTLMRWFNNLEILFVCASEYSSALFVYLPTCPSLHVLDPSILILSLAFFIIILANSRPFVLSSVRFIASSWTLNIAGCIILYHGLSLLVEFFYYWLLCSAESAVSISLDGSHRDSPSLAISCPVS